MTDIQYQNALRDYEAIFARYLKQGKTSFINGTFIERPVKPIKEKFNLVAFDGTDIIFDKRLKIEESDMALAKMIASNMTLDGAYITKINETLHESFMKIDRIARQVRFQK